VNQEVNGEILMEHEITEPNNQGAKSTLTKILNLSTGICAVLAVTWALAALWHPQANLLSGLSWIGLMSGLLITISAWHARLRVELEEPDSAE
jgi:hypothetical protein